MPETFGAADAIVREACGRRFTGAVLRVERRGRSVLERAYGAVDDSPSAGPVAIDTRFDLASLTKPFVSTAVLQAVARGRLALDEPLTAVVPEWRGTAHEAITLRQLLVHTSGMQSGADFRTLWRERVETFALCAPLAAQPGERVIYSDLGFIALGVILQRALTRSLQAIVGDTCAQAGIRHTRYTPPLRERAAIPATEDDGWRGRVRGSVHDEKAHIMGGTAGHAGLFGTARDVAVLTDAYLGAAAGRPQELLDLELARQAVCEQASDPVLRRGLGWALKTRDDNSCGARMDASTFGHTGFVGTSVWADPRHDVQVVLLTNAVYFGRHDLRDVRAAVCDAVMQDVQ